MLKFNSIKFKFSVLYVAFLGLILIIFSSLLFFSLRHTAYNNVDSNLEIKSREIKSLINSFVLAWGTDEKSVHRAAQKVIHNEELFGELNPAANMETRLLRAAEKHALRGDLINLIDANGRLIVSSRDTGQLLFSKTENHFEPYLASPLLQTVALEEQSFRVVTTPLHLRDNRRYLLQIATPFDTILNLLKKWTISILISIPIILFFASFIGNSFAMTILKPVVEIVKTAEKIKSEGLDSQVKITHVDDEMMYLVRAFNEMIFHLSKSFKHIAEFSSHVAHELKTPLAIIRGESEVALRKERDVDMYEKVLEGNMKEAERVIKVVEDLLLLSKLDYNSQIFHFERIDFQSFFKDVYEQGKILAAQKNIALAVAESYPSFNVRGDDLHLRRLFFNLIDNAIKFSSSGSQIRLAVEKGHRIAFISVSDQGVGIPREEMSQIFQKFFHRPRKKDQPSGNGLGLSIALSIAKAHGGDIKVESHLGEGSSFTVILPIL